MESQLIMSTLKRQNAFSANYSNKKFRANAPPRTNISSAVTKLRRQLEGEVELKEYTQGQTLGAVTAGTVQSLFTMAAGTDINNRIGRKISYKKLTGLIGCYVGTGTTQATSYDIVTVAIWLDRQANTLTPNYTQIMDLSVGTGLAGAVNKNTAQNAERFKCLWMKSYYISSQNTGEVDRISLNLNKILKGKDKSAEFVSSASSIPQTSGLLITFGSVNAVAASSPAVVFQLKTQFADA